VSLKDSILERARALRESDAARPAKDESADVVIICYPQRIDSASIDQASDLGLTRELESVGVAKPRSEEESAAAAFRRSHGK
jgi:hypothetical protein